MDQALATLQIPELVEWHLRSGFPRRQARAPRLFPAARGYVAGAGSHVAREELQEFQGRDHRALQNAGVRLRT